MDQSDQALEHLCRCLELEQKSLPENHVDIAQSNNSIIAAIQSIVALNVVKLHKLVYQRSKSIIRQTFKYQLRTLLTFFYININK
ncbi:unnamed protein product [Rotaria magnacalcarata]|uniref:Uncharacterized protein n=1 Tax=Rotaria magnacalcarata TaxID=392030 RepID=A0A8S2PP14_9BILA|nr:unnamed protein product [Rotaria magnacalcarata]